MKWERTENIDNMVVFTLIASASRQHPLNRYVSKACFCSHSICLLAANSPPNVVATPFCLRFQSPYPGVGQCARRRLRSKRLSPPLILHGQCMVYRCFPSHPPVVLVRVSYGWSCRGGVVVTWEFLWEMYLGNGRTGLRCRLHLCQPLCSKSRRAKLPSEDFDGSLPPTSPPHIPHH